MKALLAVLLLAGIGLVAFGPPGADPAARRDIRFAGAQPVLPMTFGHADHFAIACATCHHEFVDGTAGLPCLACHLTDAKVAPVLETQFHGLCRSCHLRERAGGDDSGPTRRCIACHLPDAQF